MTIVVRPNSTSLVVRPNTTKLVKVVAQGPQGPAGADGAAGQGVPTGGVAAQYLRKQSATDFDTAWATILASEISGLATVATSGDYNDLINLPTLVGDFTDLGDTPGVLGSAGQFVAVNGAGDALEFVNSPATPPGGVDHSLQFNDNGAFGGDGNLTYDGQDLIFDTNATVIRGAQALEISSGGTPSGNTGRRIRWGNTTDGVLQLEHGDTADGTGRQGVTIDNLAAFQESSLGLITSGGFQVGFTSPATAAANQLWTLPPADGSAGSVLETDGAGNLTFEPKPLRTIVFQFRAPTGGDIDSGVAIRVPIEIDGTIEDVKVIGDAVGSASFDVEKTTFASYPGGLASITGGTNPALIAESKSQTNLGTWTTGVSAGDVLVVSSNAVSSGLVDVSVAISVRPS